MHGVQRETFVCQHIVASLDSRTPVGFYWSREDDQEFPDSWCAECNARHERAGWEWEGEALEQLDVKLLCSSCYLDARRLSLGY
jgi:hypothetical protein